MPQIRVSAVVLLDPQNRVLSVRKAGTTMFMQPGGKPEPDESPARAAVREVREELGLRLRPERLEHLGSLSADAANEPGHTVVADVFLHPWAGEPTPHAEIVELRRDALDGPFDERFAPLLRQQIVPALITHRGFSLRRYSVADAAATREIFWSAIRTTATTAYSPQQVAAWATDDIPLDGWHRRRAAAWTLVAQTNDQVVGFGDLTEQGVLDMLFVHPRMGRWGVGRALVGAILGEARRRDLTRVDCHASHVLRPLLERMGFTVDAARDPNPVRGVNIPNWDMHIDL